MSNETHDRDEIAIVHSSDLHVDDGYTARAHGGDGTRVLRVVLEAACEAAVDVVLLVGDVFEHNRLPLDLLDRTGTVPLTAGGAVDVEKVDYVRVRFGVIPEYVLKPDNYIRELYWVKTLKVRPYWVPPPSLSS